MSHTNFFANVLVSRRSQIHDSARLYTLTDNDLTDLSRKVDEFIQEEKEEFFMELLSAGHSKDDPFVRFTAQLLGDTDAVIYDLNEERISRIKLTIASMEGEIASLQQEMDDITANAKVIHTGSLTDI